MPNLRLRHHNNCPRCPVIGAEDIPGEESYHLLRLIFNLRIARKLCRTSMLHRIDRAALEKWLERTYIDPAHVGHLPANLGPGIMATLPVELGRPLIDGNHRAARALRDGKELVVYLLPEAETLELLQGSMGRAIADHYWERMLHSQPHPNDHQPGEKP